MAAGYDNKKKFKQLNENGLDFETQSFVNHYIMNGQNGKLAFLKVRSDYEEHAAETKSAQLLKRPEVQKYLNQILNETVDIKQIQLTYLIYICKKSINEISSEKDISKKRYSDLAKFVDQLAKLGKLYQEKSNISINTSEIKISFGDWEPTIESKEPNESLVSNTTDIEFEEIKNEVLSLSSPKQKVTKHKKTESEKLEIERKMKLASELKRESGSGGGSKPGHKNPFK